MWLITSRYNYQRRLEPAAFPLICYFIALEPNEVRLIMC